MYVSEKKIRLLVDLTKRDFRLRYSGSVIGSYWNIIHPLVMIVMYTVIFSQVMKAKLGINSGPFSYSVYLCSGLIAWNLLSELVSRGVTTLIDNADFVKKLSFNPFVLFGATASTSIINFLISFALFLLFLFFVHPISLGLILLYIGVVLIFVLFGMGLAIGLGCLNVFARDFQQLTTVVFQLWFWFTPIVYLTNILPEKALTLLWFNPAFPFIESFHKIVFYKEVPNLNLWGLMLFWTVISGAFGTYVYRRTISFARDHL